MAKPVAPVQELPGEGMLRLLLEIVGNKESLDEALEVIAERREEANALIKKIAPAQEIEAMHARIRAAEGEAAQRLEAAKAEAGRLVAEAQGQADGIIAAATELEAGVKQARAEADLAKRDAETVAADVAQQIAGVAAREKAAQQAMERAEQIVQQAQAAKAAYEDKLRQLQATVLAAASG